MVSNYLTVTLRLDQADLVADHCRHSACSVVRNFGQSVRREANARRDRKQIATVRRALHEAAANRHDAERHEDALGHEAPLSNSNPGYE